MEAADSPLPFSGIPCCQPHSTTSAIRFLFDSATSLSLLLGAGVFLFADREIVNEGES